MLTSYLGCKRFIKPPQLQSEAIPDVKESMKLQSKPETQSKTTVREPMTHSFGSPSLVYQVGAKLCASSPPQGPSSVWLGCPVFSSQEHLPRSLLRPLPKSLLMEAKAGSSVSDSASKHRG